MLCQMPLSFSDLGIVNKFDMRTRCFFKWKIIVLDLKWLFSSSDVEKDSYEGKEGKD